MAISLAYKLLGFLSYRSSLHVEGMHEQREKPDCVHLPRLAQVCACECVCVGLRRLPCCWFSSLPYLAVFAAAGEQHAAGDSTAAEPQLRWPLQLRFE